MTTMETPKKVKRAPAPSPAYLRIGKRYRANRVDQQYDAIVIGSGPGGLSAAGCLSKMGWKVAVFEQHYTAGGFTHAYGRHGYEWDVGVHYIGDMGNPKNLGRKLFQFLTNGKLRWADMGEVYDTVFLGEDFHFEFPKGQAALSDALKKTFPAEQAAIDAYFKLIRQISRSMPLFSLTKFAPSWLQPLVRKWQAHQLPADMFATTGDVLNRLTGNKKLQAVLTTQWGDCGLPPGQSSFLIHALIARHYLNGGYYPEGGASKIAETILPTIQQRGGDVFTYARVNNILIDNGKAVGVEMSDGHKIFAKKIISAVGTDLTLHTLLSKNLAETIAKPEQQQQVTASMGHFSVYIGLNKSAAELELPKSNFWIYPNEHHDDNVAAFMADADETPPLVYISFPSAKDPTWDDRYPNKATIEIVAAAKHEWFAQWQDQTWGQRGDDYDALKAHWQQKLMTVLLKKLPHIKPYIDYVEIATPLSTQFFCEYRQGEIYGLNHTVDRFQQRWLSAKTPIKNLYLAGQDILTCGVVGAAMSGMLTSFAILGLRKTLTLKNAIEREQPTHKEPAKL